MPDLLLRFLIGGVVVSAFAMLGDLAKPKSFAGLFGAAPSVALATLALTVVKDGKAYAATEAHSMITGAVAFFAYAELVSWLLMRRRLSALKSTLVALPMWFTVTFIIWSALLK
jgi:hypothetical protein